MLLRRGALARRIAWAAGVVQKRQRNRSGLDAPFVAVIFGCVGVDGIPQEGAPDRREQERRERGRGRGHLGEVFHYADRVVEQAALLCGCLRMTTGCLQMRTWFRVLENGTKLETQKARPVMVVKTKKGWVKSLEYQSNLSSRRLAPPLITNNFRKVSSPWCL